MGVVGESISEFVSTFNDWQLRNSNKIDRIHFNGRYRYRLQPSGQLQWHQSLKCITSRYPGPVVTKFICRRPSPYYWNILKFMMPRARGPTYTLYSLPFASLVANR